MIFHAYARVERGRLQLDKLNREQPTVHISHGVNSCIFTQFSAAESWKYTCSGKNETKQQKLSGTGRESKQPKSVTRQLESTTQAGCNSLCGRQS